MEPFRKHVEILVRDIDKLKKLPLFISHFDLNKTNFLVGEDDEVTGIIDWELASDLPFGVGFHRFHDMAGYISRRRFVMPANFEETERGFWRVMFNNVSTRTREILETNLEAVQMALRIGSLIFYVFRPGPTRFTSPRKTRSTIFSKSSAIVCLSRGEMISRIPHETGHKMIQHPLTSGPGHRQM